MVAIKSNEIIYCNYNNNNNNNNNIFNAML